jgi:hypothetical protein
MRIDQKYGRDHDLPTRESFRFRVLQLTSALRLCERCLLHRRRCDESRRYSNQERSWKAHRATQYKSKPSKNRVA